MSTLRKVLASTDFIHSHTDGSSPLSDKQTFQMSCIRRILFEHNRTKANDRTRKKNEMKIENKTIVRHCIVPYT